MPRAPYAAEKAGYRPPAGLSKEGRQPSTGPALSTDENRRDLEPSDCLPWHSGGMGAKKPPRTSFAEIVATLPEASAATEQSFHSIPRPWITVDGDRFHLRGDVHEGKNPHKLLGQGDLIVFHEYLGQRTVIAPGEREQFWLRAASEMQASEHSDFLGYEYRNAAGSRRLVVYELC